MESLRSRLAEAVLRTLSELAQKHGTENPQLIERFRRRVLLRLNDRLNPSAAHAKILVIRAK